MTTVQLEVSIDIVKTALEHAGISMNSTPDIDRLCAHLVKELNVKEKKVIQALKDFFSSSGSESSSVAKPPGVDDFSDQTKEKEDGTDSSDSSSSDSSVSEKKVRKTTISNAKKATVEDSSSDSSIPKKGKKTAVEDSSSDSSIPKKGNKTAVEDSSSDSSIPKKGNKTAISKGKKKADESSEHEESISSESSESSVPVVKKDPKSSKKAAKESVDSSDDSEPPAPIASPSKKVKMEVVNKNVGGKDWETPPTHYTFAKKTNLIVYKDSIIAGWGKDGIRKLNKRDITACESKGWSIDQLDAGKAKKKLEKLK